MGRGGNRPAPWRGWESPFKGPEVETWSSLIGAYDGHPDRSTRTPAWRDPSGVGRTLREKSEPPAGTSGADASAPRVPAGDRGSTSVQTIVWALPLRLG